MKASISTAPRWRGGLAVAVICLHLWLMPCGSMSSASKLYADDTPVPVLAPGLGKTKTGRLWTYIRDDRSSGDTAAPAVWFAYSPDRKGEHPKRPRFTGTLQADAYAGFHHLNDTRRISEAGCWAHARRKFHQTELSTVRHVF